MESVVRVNINIGVLGHVDSGKTSLCRILSEIQSTASLDKSRQSQERGITLDLGFSAFYVSQYQVTLVDCPGHASLIKTIIGGAQIIDYMMLVIDITKGIQTQTAECIIISQIYQKRIIVVINKVDLVEDQSVLHKKVSQVQMMLDKLKIEYQMVQISCRSQHNINGLINLLENTLKTPNRNQDNDLQILIDHCFNIKGQGTVTTGTILKGQVKVGDNIWFPQLGKKTKKIQSIQMFRNNVKQAKQGDRVGIMFKPFEKDEMIERTIGCHQTGSAQYVKEGVFQINKVKFYKSGLRSKQKWHITCGHQTVQAYIYFIYGDIPFNHESEYIYAQEHSEEHQYAVIEFESSIILFADQRIIASNLGENRKNVCRLSFYGHLVQSVQKTQLKLYREKQKEGIVEKRVDNYTLLIKEMFKKTSNINVFLNKLVYLTIDSNIHQGKILCSFGNSGKVKAQMDNSLPEDVDLVGSQILLKFRKYYFQ